MPLVVPPPDNDDEVALQRFYRSAGDPTVGPAHADVAPPGALLIDTTNLKLYINTGTKATPTWTVVGTQA